MKYRAIWFTPSGDLVKGDLCTYEQALSEVITLRKNDRFAWIEDEFCNKIKEIINQ